MKIFNAFNRKKVSIYRKIPETNFDIEALKNLNLSDGSYEYNIITKKESIKSISTRQLNNALDDFYGRQNSALEEFDDFFRKNRALEAQRPFLVNLMQKIEFSEDKLLGLSILLMRDSTVEESVKFGMLLSKYYALPIFLTLTQNHNNSSLLVIVYSYIPPAYLYIVFHMYVKII